MLCEIIDIQFTIYRTRQSASQLFLLVPGIMKVLLSARSSSWSSLTADYSEAPNHSEAPNYIKLLYMNFNPRNQEHIQPNHGDGASEVLSLHEGLEQETHFSLIPNFDH